MWRCDDGSSFRDPVNSVPRGVIFVGTRGLIQLSVKWGMSPTSLRVRLSHNYLYG